MNSFFYPPGTHVIHCCEGDVGVVIDAYIDRGLVMHRTSQCVVPLPKEELRRWSVYIDGNLSDAYQQLRWSSQWDITAVDGFVCVIGSEQMETLVLLGLVEKKSRFWYKPTRSDHYNSEPSPYWAD